MATKKTTDLEMLIRTLLIKKKEVRLSDIALVAGMSKSDEGDRKSIRRVLTKMIEQGILEAHGAARARVYTVATSAPQIKPSARQNDVSIFKNIPLSQKSRQLLRYVSLPLSSRNHVSYNKDLLHSYVPNKTHYLSQTQRNQLFEAGSVESKIKPAGTYARNILNRLLIDLSWNSSRLEGNTYSLLETKRLIELGENAVGRNASEAQMILNHKEAIEYIIESAEEKKITPHSIYSIHALLSENLLGDPSASGRLRQIAVGVGGSSYLPLDNPHILKESFQIFINKFNLIKDPFEQSFFALVHLSYLQAFEDVNKRTARLVANIPLIKKNLRPLSFIEVDQQSYIQSLLGVYEKSDVALLRDLYLWSYKRSSQRYSAIQQSMGEPNLLKLKYRTEIQDIIRKVILEKIKGPQVVRKIQSLLKSKNLPNYDTEQLLTTIETEILSLHDGNIARFKIRPSEYKVWKKLQV